MKPRTNEDLLMDNLKQKINMEILDEYMDGYIRSFIWNKICMGIFKIQYSSLSYPIYEDMKNICNLEPND